LSYAGINFKTSVKFKDLASMCQEQLLKYFY